MNQLFLLVCGRVTPRVWGEGKPVAETHWEKEKRVLGKAWGHRSTGHTDQQVLVWGACGIADRPAIVQKGVMGVSRLRVGTIPWGRRALVREGKDIIFRGTSGPNPRWFTGGLLPIPMDSLSLSPSPSCLRSTLARQSTLLSVLGRVPCRVLH